MAVQVIMNQQKGPLPVKATFNSPSSAPMYLEVTGSVWTTTANQMIGIGIKIDDQAVGTCSSLLEHGQHPPACCTSISYWLSWRRASIHLRWARQLQQLHPTSMIFIP